MSCAACQHRFSAREVLCAGNPFSFACPRCGVRLTLDPLGWVLLAISCALAAPAAWYLAVAYRAGSLPFWQSVGGLALIIAAFAPVEVIYNRFARYQRR